MADVGGEHKTVGIKKAQAEQYVSDRKKSLLNPEQAAQSGLIQQDLEDLCESIREKGVILSR